jgi:hypothetical protein
MARLVLPYLSIQPDFGTVEVDWGDSINNGLKACFLCNEGAGGKLSNIADDRASGLFGAGNPTWNQLANTSVSKRGLAMPGGTTVPFVSCGSSVQISGECTVSAWVNTTNVSTINTICEIGNASADVQMRLEIGRTAGKFGLLWGNAGAGYDTPTASSSSLVANQWVHLAATRFGSGTAWTCYFQQNGVVVNGPVSATHAVQGSGGTLFIGSQNGVTTQTFSGTVADIRVWNRGLSGPELARLYTDGPQVGLMPAGRRFFSIGKSTGNRRRRVLIAGAAICG